MPKRIVSEVKNSCTEQDLGVTVWNLTRIIFILSLVLLSYVYFLSNAFDAAFELCARTSFFERLIRSVCFRLAIWHVCRIDITFLFSLAYELRRKANNCNKYHSLIFFLLFSCTYIFGMLRLYAFEMVWMVCFHFGVVFRSIRRKKWTFSS